MGSLWKSAGAMLLWILNFFYGITGSYGLSIVLLTILVRLILYPLNQKQMVSMQHMQKIQPRIKMIQEKYAHDKEKMNQEMMRLYKEHKVNPAAGCLPLLIQLPILILLFNVLRTYDFAGTSFFGILLGSSTVDGLAKAVGLAAAAEGERIGITAILGAIAKNPAGLANIGFYMPNLLLLIGISVLTWLQQKMSSANNPQMAMMGTIMPFFMAFICLSMPGGVMLYWGLSSLIGIVQQYYIMKKTKVEMSVKPTLYKNKPTRGKAKTEEYYDDYDDYYEDDDDDEYEYVYVDDDEYVDEYEDEK